MSSFYKAFDQPFGGPTSTAHDDQRAIEEKRTFSHEVGSCYPKAVRTRFESMIGGATPRDYGFIGPEVVSKR